MSFPFDPGAVGLTFKNTTGEVVPPYSIMYITGIEWSEAQKSFFATVTKPHVGVQDPESGGNIGQAIMLLNGPTEVAVDKSGKGMLAIHQPAWVKVSAEMRMHHIYGPGGTDIGPLRDDWVGYIDGYGLHVVDARPDPANPDDNTILDNRVLVLQPWPPPDLLVKITSTVGEEENPIAVYRDVGNCTVVRQVEKAINVFADVGREFTVYTHWMNGVHFTGDRVHIRHKIINDGSAREITYRRHICTTGDNYWENAIVTSAIVEAGSTGTVELYDGGPSVDASSKWALPVDTLVEVMFDDDQQEFIIVAPHCPPDLAAE